MCNHNGSDSVGTEKILQDKDFLVPCRLSMGAIGLSMCPNNTHPYIELNHEPKNLNPTSYQVVAHIYPGEGRGPLPNLHSRVTYCFRLCVVDALLVLVNLFYLFTLFDAHAHKTNNTTVLDTQCTKIQNKHELLIMVQSVFYSKTNKQQEIESDS